MKKIFCYILALVILQSSLSGCGTSELLSISEASQLDNKKSLILHAGNKVYTLDNYKLLDDKLTGNLKKHKNQKGYTIHVYTDLQYDLKLNELKIDYVELQNHLITKVENRNKQTGKTLALTGGVFAGTLGILYVIGMSGYAAN